VTFCLIACLKDHIHFVFFCFAKAAGEARQLRRRHQVELQRGAFAPGALKHKTGDNRLRSLDPAVIEALRSIEGNNPCALVSDTTNLVKLFRRSLP